MDCREFQDQLADFVHNRLDEGRRAAFEAHVRGCAECRGVLETDCKQIADFLLDYVEGGLDPQIQRVFERHIVLCTCCKEYLSTYRRTIELEGQLACDDPRLMAEIPTDLVTAILAASRGR